MIEPIKKRRGALGTKLDPNSAWMITRSMETLSLRMRKAADNAGEVATFCERTRRSPPSTTWDSCATSTPRCRSSTPMRERRIDVRIQRQRRRSRSLRLLDRLEVIKLAVSLGGTETLASHPASTTHSGVPKALDRLGITDS